MWQPGWEGNLEEDGYMYMYGRVPLLATWNYHNIVCELAVPQYKVKLKKERGIKQGSIWIGEWAVYNLGKNKEKTRCKSNRGR